MEGYVYLLHAQKPFDECYKIGMTTDPQQRFRAFGVRLPYPVKVVMVSKVRDCRTTERSLHTFFAKQRLDGEWFKLAESDVRAILISALIHEADGLINKLLGSVRAALEQRNDDRAMRLTYLMIHASRRLERRHGKLNKLQSRELNIISNRVG